MATLFDKQAIADVLRKLLDRENPAFVDGQEMFGYTDAILDVANELGVKL